MNLRRHPLPLKHTRAPGLFERHDAHLGLAITTAAVVAIGGGLLLWALALRS